MCKSEHSPTTEGERGEVWGGGGGGGGGGGR